MMTTLDCIPCFVRQALEAARFSSADPRIHERILRRVLRSTAEMDFAQPPPVTGQRIHRLLREVTGITDPYREKKQHFTALARQLLPELRAQVLASNDPLAAAVRVAIAGNVIDLGPNGTLTAGHAQELLERAFYTPITGDIEAFRDTVRQAANILYLADNAGEIVLDGLLIEQLPDVPITVAVRGAPVLNDATAEDALEAGLDKMAIIVDNGSDAPGTLLEDCSAAFRGRFFEAGLIIAKGQGNYETLSDVAANIRFLFKAKCPVIARSAGVPLNALVLAKSKIQAGESARMGVQP
jgi:damage-control phosphatase, subfamily I